jgi:GNAT superfamily N-acetyltransferase
MVHDQERKSTTTDAPPEISIGLATSEDVDALLALASICIDHMRSHGIEQWDEVYPDPKTIEEDVRSGTTFVASKTGEIVGALVLDDHQEPEYAEVPWQFTAGPAAVVHRLMIRPAFEGRGLARALMKFAEGRAWTLGYRAVRLDAFTENPKALGLYERLEYRSAGQVRFRKGYFRCFEKLLGGAS